MCLSALLLSCHHILDTYHHTVVAKAGLQQQRWPTHEGNKDKDNRNGMTSPYCTSCARSMHLATSWQILAPAHNLGCPSDARRGSKATRHAKSQQYNMTKEVWGCGWPQLLTWEPILVLQKWCSCMVEKVAWGRQAHTIDSHALIIWHDQ